jgi:hypothetical protein
MSCPIPVWNNLCFYYWYAHAGRIFIHSPTDVTQSRDLYPLKKPSLMLLFAVLAVSYWPCPLSSRGICRWGPITVPAKARWWALDPPPSGLPVSLMDLFLITGVPRAQISSLPIHLSHTPPTPPTPLLPISAAYAFFAHVLYPAPLSAFPCIHCMAHMYISHTSQNEVLILFITYLLIFRPLIPKIILRFSFPNTCTCITPVPVINFLVFVVIFPSHSRSSNSLFKSLILSYYAFFCSFLWLWFRLFLISGFFCLCLFLHVPFSVEIVCLSKFSVVVFSTWSRNISLISVSFFF